MKLDEFFNYLFEGPNDPHRYKAIFMAGAPGSGKSFVAKRLTDSTGLRRIDMDRFVEIMAKKSQQDTQKIYTDKKQKKRAKELVSKQKGLAIEGGLGLLIDGTGRDYKTVERLKNFVEQYGYDTMMVYVNTDIQTAQKRAQQRERKVSSQFLKQAHKDVQDNLGKYQNLFSPQNMLIIDNSENIDKEQLKEELRESWKRVRKFITSPSENQERS